MTSAKSSLLTWGGTFKGWVSSLIFKLDLIRSWFQDSSLCKRKWKWNTPIIIGFYLLVAGLLNFRSLTRERNLWLSASLETDLSISSRIRRGGNIAWCNLSKRDPDGGNHTTGVPQSWGAANQSGTLSFKVSGRGIALSDTKEAQLLYFRRAKMKTFSLTVRFKRINKIRRLIKQSDS